MAARRLQRTIGYYKPAGGAMVNTGLTPSQSWPNCYTAQVVMFAAPWFETLSLQGVYGRKLLGALEQASP